MLLREKTMLRFKNIAILTCLAIVIILSIKSCIHHRHLTTTDIVSIYSIPASSPLPFYSLFQYTEDSLRLYFTIPARTFHPTEEKESSDVKQYKLHFRLISQENSGKIIDSATYLYDIKTIDAKLETKGYIEMYTTDSPENKILSVVVEDVDQLSKNTQYFELIDPHPPGRYHYSIYDKTRSPVTSNRIYINQKIIIKSSIIKNQEITVRYYDGLFPVAYPPYATTPFQPFNYKADSIFKITFNDGETSLLSFSKPGKYHITADTNSRKGFTFFIRKESFPWITQPEQMVPPLRYLTTNKEFKELIENDNPKAAVDQFWIKQAGNEHRARRLIREYYHRVEKANYLFSSYQDGWRTDKGMIYIMYGVPNSVRRTQTTETWVYGESKSLFALRFVFHKMSNPFTDNDYLLERAATYKSGWHQMVNSWRR